MFSRPRFLLPIVFGVFAGCRAPSSQRPQVANHTGGGIQAVPSLSPIRAVDWANRTYQSGDASYPVSEGQYAYEDEEMTGYFSVAPPVYGDLDGDGAEEAVIITLENMGGTGQFSGIDVYAMRDGVETIIGGIPGGDRGDGGISDVHVEGQVVIVDRFMSQDGDGACCPSKVQIERWTWSGGELVEDERARRLVDNAAE